MTNIKQIQTRPVSWRRSGNYHGRRPIAFELRFEPGYEEAREWLYSAATRDELDNLCQAARVTKNMPLRCAL
jgi:hypothetical protein